MRVIGKRVLLYVSTFVLVVGSAVIALRDNSAYAAQITNRSLTLETGATGTGGSTPGGVVNHQFKFTVPTGGSISSIMFQYCTVASVDTCVTPNGLDTSTATLGSEAGSAATGFTINTTTNGSPYLTRTASVVAANSVLAFRLDHITNPTAANTTFFVRIATYSTANATGTPIDTGSVAASTATPIVLTGTMPESIIFCTGATITKNTGGIPDCTTATSGNIVFNQLFSPTDTATAQSQMAASTNASQGYAISVTGTTLTSGTNTITAMTSPTTGSKGSSQFGLNLKANTTATSTTPVGAEITPASNGTNFKAEPTVDYSTADTFKFNPAGETIADSASGGTGGPTDSQIYTISYIVNVPGSQPAGTYTTTLTYICTATF